LGQQVPQHDAWFIALEGRQTLLQTKAFYYSKFAVGMAVVKTNKSKLLGVTNPKISSIFLFILFKVKAAAVRRRCEDGAKALRRRCEGGAKAVQRRCEGAAKALRRRCEGAAKALRSRLRPSRKFLEKFKIIFFSNFSRNYFREIREIRETRFKVIFVF
jgi:hypothetical protein